MEQVRQGDLLIIRHQSIPDGVKIAKNKILALGEVTGHMHRAVGDATVYDFQGGKWVLSEKGWRISHDEHDPIKIPAGIFEIRRQREYSPEEIRKVVD